MFSKLGMPFGIQLDFVLASAGSYALLFYLWYNYVQDITVAAGSALMRGLQYGLCVIISEVLLRNFDFTGISFIRTLKDTVGVDLLSALLMIPLTNYVVGEKLYSLEFAPIVLGLAFTSDLLGHSLVGIINHPMIVGKDEAASIQMVIADRRVSAADGDRAKLPPINPLEQQLF